jgi:hypothetical protein
MNQNINEKSRDNMYTYQFKEVVLFPFDNYSIPFRHGLQLELIQAKRYEQNPILKKGESGAPDNSAMAHFICGILARVILMTLN